MKKKLTIIFSVLLLASLALYVKNRLEKAKQKAEEQETHTDDDGCWEQHDSTGAEVYDSIVPIVDSIPN